MSVLENINQAMEESQNVLSDIQATMTNLLDDEEKVVTLVLELKAKADAGGAVTSEDLQAVLDKATAHKAALLEQKDKLDQLNVLQDTALAEGEGTAEPVPTE